MHYPAFVEIFFFCNEISYISCVMGCPYEGEINPEKVNWVAEKLWNMGALSALNSLYVINL